MLLNIKDAKTRALVKPLFEADCALVGSGRRPKRAWETDIYVTRRCNMSCSYCYVKDYFDRGYPFVDPTMGQLRDLVDRLAGRTYGLVVLGGEPLIRQDLPELLQYARERGIPSLRLASNGTLVRRSSATLRCLDRLNVSLDFTRQREFPAKTAQMLQDLPAAREQLGSDFPSVCISYTLAHGETFAADIMPIVRYADEHGFDIKFLPCKYPNRDVDWEFLRVVLRCARDHIAEERILNIRELTEKIDHAFLLNNCLQGMQYYIDFEGYFLYPCDEFPVQRVGSIYEHSLDELYEMGRAQFGDFPNCKAAPCARCKSYCHAENSYNYRHPQRQFRYLL